MRSTATPVLGTPEAASRPIEYLSPPAQVSMAQRWFEIASLDHFWIRRRFAVLQKLAGQRISDARQLAEVGCGHGLLQRQIEDAYGKEVWGFDLNELALQRNVSRLSRLCSYDIVQRNPSLREGFDIVFLFDVLEHISDETSFLQALLFHVSRSGSVVINVPAGEWAYSPYDDAVGHVRRYSIQAFRRVINANGLALKAWTYWGLPLVPSLLLRKLWLLRKHDQSDIIAVGLDSRSSTVNALMGFLSNLEWIPQKFLGTSLMAVLEPADQKALSSSERQ